MSLDPQVYTNLETLTERLIVDEYSNAVPNLNYERWTKVRASAAGKHIVYHRLPFATLENKGHQGGSVQYDDQIVFTKDYTIDVIKGGTKIPESRFADLDGQGYDIMAEWVRDITARFAYWPQQEAIRILKAGESLTCFDSVALFGTHYVNPKATGLGSYKNLLTSSAAGLYPGACPIGGAYGAASAQITLEEAWVNLFKAIAYIRSVTMPDGVTPRYLKPTTILCSPALQQRVLELTQAKFIAMSAGAAASGAGGSGDIEGIINSLGFKPPIVLPELASATAADNYTYYLVCEEEQQRSQYGSIMYWNREPFQVQMYTRQTSVELAESDEIKWVAKGRNTAGVGQPQFIWKVKPA